ncbi:MAG: hypothetical protein LQ341_007002, partial [Variospora aurantia]
LRMTSIAARAKGASLVKGFNGAIQAQVLALAEYQVARHASSNPNFVRAAEGGVFDCGIWVGDEALVGSMTDKFFQITSSNRRSVVPAEIKSVTPKSDHKGNVWWRLNLSAVQYDRGGAVFITSPYEPDFVAVVPMEYIRRRTTRRSVPSITDECFRVNIHTGVHYDVKPPEVYTSTVLEPSMASWKTGLRAVKEVYDAFQTQPSDFTLHFVEILPITGDFKLVHEGTGLELIVEAKKCHCDFDLGQGPDSSMTHSQWAVGMSQRHCIFAWKAQWDFLYTTSRSGREALFIPRDEIPQSWWNYQGAELSWPQEDIDVLYQYVVQLEPATQLLEGIKRILQTRERNHPLKAQRSIAIEPIHVDALAERTTPKRETLEEPVAFSDGVDPDGPDSPDGLVAPTHGWHLQDYRRGFGSYRHTEGRGESYEAWAAAVLITICRQQSVKPSDLCSTKKLIIIFPSVNGAVVDLGSSNRMCRFMIGLYPWTPTDIERFDRHGTPPRAYQIPKGTPMVRLGFMRLEWPGGYYPKSSRSAEYIMPILTNRMPTLVIVDMLPMRAMRLPHSRFVMPFSALPTIKTKGLIVEPRHGTWDQYSIDEEQLTDVLTSILHGHAETSFGRGDSPAV